MKMADKSLFSAPVTDGQSTPGFVGEARDKFNIYFTMSLYGAGIKTVLKWLAYMSKRYCRHVSSSSIQRLTELLVLKKSTF